MLRQAQQLVSRAALAAKHESYSYQLNRFLNVHEYQGSDIMKKYGVNVPPGIAVSSLEDFEKAAKEMADESGEVVLKSQILAGGRGLGKFTNGLQGGVHIAKLEKAKELAGKMLGSTLVTKQTGPAGKPVNTLYVAKKMKLKREMYFAILLDRKSAGPVMIGCSVGGVSIEDLAEKYPEQIIKIPIDIRVGITDAQAAAMVEGLKVTGDKKAALQQIKALYELFSKADCTMVEVNPLAEDVNGNLISADAKIGFDDNAAFRQKEIFALKDDSQIDSREVAAAKFDLNYIGLDGEIGCMVNGAGLAMATMDIIKQHGGTPANFLDVGGNASEQQVVEAFKILTADPQVKAILVNIFGGIMKCDVIASGIVNAVRQVGVKVPLVVRLEGTNVQQGKDILKNSGLPIITADDLDDAAKKAVATIQPPSAPSSARGGPASAHGIAGGSALLFSALATAHGNSLAAAGGGGHGVATVKAKRLYLPKGANPQLYFDPPFVQGVADVSRREFWMVFPYLMVALWMGIFPNYFIAMFENSDMCLTLIQTAEKFNRPGYH